MSKRGLWGDPAQGVLGLRQGFLGFVSPACVSICGIILFDFLLDLNYQTKKVPGMSKLQELMAARMDIEKRIDEMQREARSGSIAKVRSLMAEFGLTAADIAGKAPGGRVSGAAKPKGKVAVKYHNAATGDSWSGRGLQPRWLKAALAAGAKVTDFAV